MGMSTHVVGFRPVDETWKRHLAVWEACENAGVKIPAETEKFFGGEDPTNKPGVEVDIKHAVAVFREDCREGFDVDLSALSHTIKILRFYNSW